MFRERQGNQDDNDQNNDALFAFRQFENVAHFAFVKGESGSDLRRNGPRVSDRVFNAGFAKTF